LFKGLRTESFERSTRHSKKPLQLQKKNILGCEPKHPRADKDLAASHDLQAACDLIVASLDVHIPTSLHRVDVYLDRAGASLDSSGSSNGAPVD
jgi:hypothetical protein